MNHEEMNTGLLRAYLDEQIEGEEAAMVKQHVEDCAGCQADLQALQARAAFVRTGLGELPQWSGNTSAAWGAFQQKREDWLDMSRNRWSVARIWWLAEEETVLMAKTPEANQDRRDWIDTTIWTERMLTALENGVQGNKWYSLMDKVAKLPTLQKAYEQVARNDGAAGVDHISVKEFGENLEENLEKLVRELRNGKYRPQAIKRVWIPKPGSKEKRPLGIPTVRDRVVQAAVVKVVEPIWEVGFAEQSYGFRPQRSCKDALRRVEQLLKEGNSWVVDADLKGYFDSIPHAGLMRRVAEKIADGAVLDLVESFLKVQVMDTMKGWQPEAGTPQGAVLSPLLSNIYLNPLDQQMAREGYEMVRYADDFVILCRSQAEAEEALERVRQWTQQEGLQLHADKTRLINCQQAGEGFEFLGYRFANGSRRPRAKSLKKLKDILRQKTQRTQGHSLSTILESVNRSLRGWFEYFQHSRRWIFDDLDAWIRMRLRSILRRREGRKGCGRGADHQRWPNAYFAEQGLFSLQKAHALARQSCRR